jgi:hypothetical protein
VVVELDGDVVGAEQGDEAVEFTARRLRALLQRLAHGALAAPREDEPMATGQFGELLEVVARPALLAARELSGRDGRGEAVIALLLARKHEQVGALGIGDAVLRGTQAEGELGADDRGDTELGGRLGHAHGAVEPVVIGEREGGETEPCCLLGHAFGHRGAVEEAEARVRVQLRVGHDALRGREPVGPVVGLALVGPRGAVAAVRPGRGRRSGPRYVGETTLELRPGDGRVTPAHGGASSSRASQS